MELHVSYDVTRTYRASIPCTDENAAKVLAEMMHTFYVWMKYQDDRAAIGPKPMFRVDPIPTGRYVTDVKLHAVEVDEPAWHDTTVQLGLRDRLNATDLKGIDRQDLDRALGQLTEALRNQGYLPYPDCPTEPDACGERWPHEWKHGSHHACAQVPGHKFKHVCSCEADDF